MISYDLSFKPDDRQASKYPLTFFATRDITDRDIGVPSRNGANANFTFRVFAPVR